MKEQAGRTLRPGQLVGSATIPPRLKAWAEEERPHGGVIFVDQRTFLSSDFGGLIRSRYSGLEH